jgi:hypothetical protein
MIYPLLATIKSKAPSSETNGGGSRMARAARTFVQCLPLPIVHTITWLLIGIPPVFLVGVASSAETTRVGLGVSFLGLAMYCFSIGLLTLARNAWRGTGTAAPALFQGSGLFIGCYLLTFIALTDPFTVIGVSAIFVSVSLFPIVLLGYEHFAALACATSPSPQRTDTLTPAQDETAWALKLTAAKLRLQVLWRPGVVKAWPISALGLIRMS